MRTTSLTSRIIQFTICVFLLGAFSFNNVSAQAPQAFNYQGVARSGDGSPIANQNISLRTSLVQGSDDGNVLYQETQSTVTSDRGLFVVRIGEGSPVEGSIQDIDWSQSPFYLRVEMDPNGGSGFVQIGASQLYSVPYALYADKAGNSSGSDGISGTILGENGNNNITLVPLESDANKNVGLSRFYDEEGEERAWYGISPSNGSGSMGLKGKSGGVKAFLQAKDEVGRLELNGTNGQKALLAVDATANNGFLSLYGTNGNFNTYIGNWNDSPDLGLIRLFDEQGSAKVNLSVLGSDQSGLLTLQGADGNTKMFLQSNNNAGGLYLRGPDSESNKAIMAVSGGVGKINLTGKNGNINAALSTSWDDDFGAVKLYDGEGTQKALFGVVPTTNAGYFEMKGSSGAIMIQATQSDSLLANGVLHVNNSNGGNRATIMVKPENEGELLLKGANGNANVRVGSWDADNPDNGSFDIYDSDGAFKAYIGVSPSTNNGFIWVGDGTIVASNVSNLVDNPAKSGERIAYTMLQGPEAGSYVRGTAQLVNGRASIDFPTHFSQNIMDEGITVSITPLSAESKGIAVVKKASTGIRVVELLEGNGNYEFDWEVKGKRKVQVAPKQLIRPTGSSNK